MQAFEVVTREAFTGKCWKHPGHYRYAQTFNLVPVAANELVRVAAHLPLAFIQAADRWQMVAITSLLPGTNLLVGPQGQWLGGYVPAVLRGHPFSLTQPAEGEDYLLCVQGQGDHLVGQGQGFAFFDAAGELTAETRRAMDFLVDVEAGRAQATQGVQALADAKLLTPWALTANHNGQAYPVEGLFRLDATAFSALKTRAMDALHKVGAVPLAYAQLFSVEQMVQLQRAIQMQEQLRSAPRAARG